MPTDAVPALRTEHLELVSMEVPFMEALRDGDLDRAAELVGAACSPWLPVQLEHFLQYRLAQLEVDPGLREWLGRVMILDEGGSRRVVGTIGFHGAPDEQGRLEVGYSVDPEFRRRGFARESVHALFDWAHAVHGVRRFIASVSPDNEPSLNLVRSLGFEQTGSHVDDIDGLELELEVDWPRPTSTA